MIKESEWAKKSLSRILAKKVSEYLKKEENRHEFEKWYERKNGKNYAIPSAFSAFTEYFDMKPGIGKKIHK